MRTLLLVSLLSFGELGAGLLLGSQQDSATSTQKNAEVISGSVINSVSDSLLSGAVVVLRPTVTKLVSRTTTTDNSGHFEIKDIVPGKYRISADKFGFVKQDFGAKQSWSFGTELVLASEQKMTNIKIPIIPKGILVGKVVNADGEAMASLPVQAFQYQYVRGFHQLIAAGVQATTNDLGEYRIAGLAPGRYYLGVGMPSSISLGSKVVSASDHSLEESYSNTYYPSDSTLAGATMVSVDAGAETRGLTITLRKSHVFHIRGTVMDGTTGSPAQLCNVVAYSRLGEQLSPVRAGSFLVSGSTGQFDIGNLLPGPYTLIVYAGNVSGGVTAAYQLNLGNESLEHQTLILGGAELLVHATLQTDKNNLQGTTSSLPNPTELSKVIATLVFDGLSTVPVSYTKLDENGVGTLKNLSAQHYRLLLNGSPKGFYLQSAKLEDQDVLENGFDYVRGAKSLELVFSPTAASLSGRVQNSKNEPMSRALVSLIPKNQSNRTDLIHRTITERDGSFTMDSIAPGDYEAYAWEDLGYGASFDPALLTALKSKAGKVKLASRDHPSIQLQVIEIKDIESAEKNPQ